MIKYFSIAIEGLSPNEERQLAESWQGYAWWHGVANFWLLRDHTGTMAAPSIRDNIKNISTTAAVMVVEVAPTMWAGSSMTQSNRDWLKSYWPPEGS
ncbi:hypothetical protein RMS29_001790 [Agrobacterium rosae]|uniref:SinR family protein n=1 Tax=Agrobacterium rosae TaxID=1972867 RepID=A0ABU4VWH8_9HYPH|nr:hypothetical protein [Agrobacterium rosae]